MHVDSCSEEFAQKHHHYLFQFPLSATLPLDILARPPDQIHANACLPILYFHLYYAMGFGSSVSR